MATVQVEERPRSLGRNADRDHVRLTDRCLLRRPLEMVEPTSLHVRAGRVCRRALLAFAALASAVVVTPTAAVAQSPLATEVQSELEAVVEYNYRGGVTNPATAPSCNAKCQALYDAERRPSIARPITVNHPALYDMHQVLLRRDEGADPTTPLVEVELRKGWTRAHVTKEWAGWGWRHIQAKHGWSPDDTVATQQALQFPPVRQPNGALRYVGATYVQNGESCARVVIVRDRVRSGEPMPAGIITSYGELIP